MKIAVACDHGGLALKAPLIQTLQELGHDVVDLGAHQLDPQDDYPDFARYVGQAIQHQQAERGVLICGSGVGACIAANKLTGVRAGLCHDAYSARQGVEHDNMNVLCLGARVIGPELAKDLVRAFASAQFSGEARHLRRLEKIKAMEASG
ncbi:MAG TPA: ribose 5-phosphate isomerase B [Phycisphaeraceae bacterium]